MRQAQPSAPHLGARGAIAVARLLELRPRAGEAREGHLGRVRALLEDPELEQAMHAVSTIYGHATVAQALGVPVALVLAQAAPELAVRSARPTWRRHACEDCDGPLPRVAAERRCAACRVERLAVELEERRRAAEAARRPTRPVLLPLRRAA